MPTKGPEDIPVDGPVGEDLKTPPIPVGLYTSVGEAPSKGPGPPPIPFAEDTP